MSGAPVTRKDSKGDKALNTVAEVIGQKRGAAIPLTLTGGAHTFTAITPGKSYRAISNVDVFLRASAVSSIFGAQMTLNTDGYNNGTQDWSANTEVAGLLASATDAATFEFWAEKDGLVATTNNDRYMSMGGGAVSRLDLVFYPSGGVWKYQVYLNDATGTIVFSITNGVTTVSSDTNLHHPVFTIDRADDSVTVFIDGSQADKRTSIGMTAAAVTFNTTGMYMHIGESIGSAPNFDGTMYDFKIYKSALTLAQVVNRNARGIVTSPADLYRDTPTSTDPVIWYSFQDSATWTDPTKPEPVVGYGTTPDLTLDVLTGSPAIVVQSGGEPATTNTSSPNISGNPETIKTTSTDAYINAYTKPGVIGTLWLTEV